MVHGHCECGDLAWLMMLNGEACNEVCIGVQAKEMQGPWAGPCTGKIVESARLNDVNDIDIYRQLKELEYEGTEKNAKSSQHSRQVFCETIPKWLGDAWGCLGYLT